MEQDQQFVEYIVKSIVEHPDEVSLNRTIDERGTLLELTVNPEDMGKIIGKEGKTAKSIRTLLRVLGAKTDSRINLKIVEPEGTAVPAEANADFAAPDLAQPYEAAAVPTEQAAAMSAEQAAPVESFAQPVEPVPAEPEAPTAGSEATQAAQDAMAEARSASDLEI